MFEHVFVFSVLDGILLVCRPGLEGRWWIRPLASTAVDDVIDSAAGHLNAQHGRLVSAVVWMLDHVEQWQGDGLWTPEAYLRWRTGVAPATASKIVDVARRADEFPECVTALQRGELSLDQIAPITRHAPGWCDTQMAGLAPRCTVAQISKIAREYPWDLDRDVDGDDGRRDGRCERHDRRRTGGRCRHRSDRAPTNPARTATPRFRGRVVQPADEAWFGWGDDGRFRLQSQRRRRHRQPDRDRTHRGTRRLFQAGDDPVDTVDAVIEIAQRLARLRSARLIDATATE